MDFVPIAEISVASGRLHVTPGASQFNDFEYIYRTATGVRWLRAERCFVPHEVGGLTHGAWFGEILAAAASEYGVRLEVTPSTIWRDVSAELRSEIESQSPRSAV